MVEIKVGMLSDTHGHHDEIKVPECDVLIFAGDMCVKGAHVEEMTSFARWLVTRGAAHVVFVAGNHDFTKTASLQRPKYRTDAAAKGAHLRALTDASRWAPNSCDVHVLSPVGMVGIPVDGAPPLIVAGSAACQMPDGPWVYNWKASAIEKAVSGLSRCDVFVSHSPARGVMDTLAWGVRCGEEAYADYVRRANPALHVFGHVHAERGLKRDMEGVRTVAANVAMCDDYYSLKVNRASTATLRFADGDWSVAEIKL